MQPPQLELSPATCGSAAEYLSSIPPRCTEVEITNATDTSGHLHATDNVVKNLSKNVVVKSASTFQPANAEEDDASILDDDSTPTSAGPSSSEESRMEALRSMESVTIRPEEAVDDAKEQQQNFPKEHSGTLVARGPEPDRSRRPEYDFDNPTSGGTNVYIVAIVGVVPAAGAVIWCVRKMIAKKRENKENPDAPPAEEDDKHTVEQDPPTKYSYIQDAYNKMYAKTIGELMPTWRPEEARATRRWCQGSYCRPSGESTKDSTTLKGLRNQSLTVSAATCFTRADQAPVFFLGPTYVDKKIAGLRAWDPQSTTSQLACLPASSSTHERSCHQLNVSAPTAPSRPTQASQHLVTLNFSLNSPRDLIVKISSVASSAPPYPRASAPVASSPDEVPRDDVRLERVLGEGNFGRVWKATAYGLNGSKRSTPVAVKTLKGTLSFRIHNFSGILLRAAGDVGCAQSA
ncbi:hypothetical protein HPB51_012892 [Rhipicephalus microplus]|uniref:Protein kinase domain-containing protein n=1 Tax=Rhipicephalus microplus TaxID=6941 RepID=A0A9J6EGT0_RHIMP|nr:hypothetical protein HPB51_012892 [Rhipicephalus microplus]